MTRHRTALLILMLVPMLWGLSLPLVKMASAYMRAEVFVTIRFLLAAFSLLPWVLMKLGGLSKKRISQAFLLGVLNGACLICQTIGIKTLDAASSAFIADLAVLIVPFLLPVFQLGMLRLLNIVCALLCLLGLYLLTGAKLEQNWHGVLWTLACAFFYALFVVYLQKVKPKKHEVLLFSFYQIIGSGIFASFLLLPTIPHSIFNMTTIVALGFCGICATALVLILQTRYQQYVPATQVMFIYSLEALFAALFSFILLHEHFSLQSLCGGLLMLASIVLNELYAQNTLALAGIKKSRIGRIEKP